MTPRYLLNSGLVSLLRAPLHARCHRSLRRDSLAPCAGDAGFIAVPAVWRMLTQRIYMDEPGEQLAFNGRLHLVASTYEEHAHAHAHARSESHKPASCLLSHPARPHPPPTHRYDEVIWSDASDAIHFAIADDAADEASCAMLLPADDQDFRALSSVTSAPRRPDPFGGFSEREAELFQRRTNFETFSSWILPPSAMANADDNTLGKVLNDSLALQYAESSSATTAEWLQSFSEGSPYKCWQISTNGRCGPDANYTTCPKGQACCLDPGQGVAICSAVNYCGEPPEPDPSTGFLSNLTFRNVVPSVLSSLPWGRRLTQEIIEPDVEWEMDDFYMYREGVTHDDADADSPEPAVSPPALAHLPLSIRMAGLPADFDAARRQAVLDAIADAAQLDPAGAGVLVAGGAVEGTIELETVHRITTRSQLDFVLNGAAGLKDGLVAALRAVGEASEITVHAATGLKGHATTSHGPPSARHLLFGTPSSHTPRQLESSPAPEASTEPLSESPSTGCSDASDDCAAGAESGECADPDFAEACCASCGQAQPSPSPSPESLSCSDASDAEIRSISQTKGSYMPPCAEGAQSGACADPDIAEVCCASCRFPPSRPPPMLPPPSRPLPMLPPRPPTPPSTPPHEWPPKCTCGGSARRRRQLSSQHAQPLARRTLTSGLTLEVTHAEPIKPLVPISSPRRLSHLDPSPAPQPFPSPQPDGANPDANPDAKSSSCVDRSNDEVFSRTQARGNTFYSCAEGYASGMCADQQFANDLCCATCTAWGWGKVGCDFDEAAQNIFGGTCADLIKDGKGEFCTRGHRVSPWVGYICGASCGTFEEYRQAYPGAYLGVDLDSLFQKIEQYGLWTPALTGLSVPPEEDDDPSKEGIQIHYNCSQLEYLAQAWEVPITQAYCTPELSVICPVSYQAICVAKYGSEPAASKYCYPGRQPGNQSETEHVYTYQGFPLSVGQCVDADASVNFTFTSRLDGDGLESTCADFLPVRACRRIAIAPHSIAIAPHSIASAPLLSGTTPLSIAIAGVLRRSLSS